LKDIYKVFDKSKSSFDFRAIEVSLASPEKILEWSYGEVKKPETLNHRTYKPEKDGLFCAKIFGPINDYECLCGKYRRMKYKGIVCEKCGVEVIESKVRRERMGHITLATPVAHIWYVKTSPFYINTLLGMSNTNLSSVIYCEGYVVLRSEIKGVVKGQYLEEEQYNELLEKYGPDQIEAETGAAPLRQLLEEMDLVAVKKEVEEELANCGDKNQQAKLQKRINVFNKFIRSGERPENMILTVLPVLPPDLRPLVPLEGGSRFATSDLNDLYRRVLNRNIRLKKLMDLGAPDVIIKNETRMLQEAVDALFDNTKVHRPVQGANGRALKSLSEMLKGKGGRFRQNLLGKRVDYSGRSVITVGPELKLHECGLPKVMALELFKPFIYNKLSERNLVSTVKAAKNMVEAGEDVVWEILEEVVKEHPVLLNRAPTLHRLGIQAFEPVLIDSKAIRLHPLVCVAFNADFDGDQMAVHLPLSIEAQLESRVLMMSTNNILSPASGTPVISPAQDMVLGLYYLTTAKPYSKGEGKVFYSDTEALMARDSGIIDWQSIIKVRIDGKIYTTTAGRLLIWAVTPKELGFETINRQLKKGDWTSILDRSFRVAGGKATVVFADKIKNLGYQYSTKAAYSISIDDIKIPAEKAEIIAETEKSVREVEDQYNNGNITKSERYNKIVDLWGVANERVTKKMMEGLKETMIDHELWGKIVMPSENSVYVMADSKARGSQDQIRQLGGMRGLMSKPNGDIIETPILANFKEGLDSLDYFTSTHGARKGSADTALKTANSGYLTRRLVDVAQDVVVVEEDCGTNSGVDVEAMLNESGEIIAPLKERILGRVALDDIEDPDTGEIILEANTMIDEAAADKIVDLGIDSVRIRSVLTCRSPFGVCAKCYGRDLARGHIVNVGEAVGFIAAQSIGEPGTQLTMRTFHVGGVASGKSEKSSHEAKRAGKVEYRGIKLLQKPDGTYVVMNRNGKIVIQDDKGRDREKYPVSYGTNLKVADGAHVAEGTVLADWDPYNDPIIAETDGIIAFEDLENGITMREEQDLNTGLTKTVVIPSRDAKMSPQLLITEEGKKGRKTAKKLERGEAVYHLPVNAYIEVRNGDAVKPGDVLAKVPRAARKTKDITGGLPRISDLFEARKVKNPAKVSEISGIVSITSEGKSAKSSKRLITVTPVEGGEAMEPIQIPKEKHINVHDGDTVEAGEALIEGTIDPHDILRISGEVAVAKFLVQEVQRVYKLQGVPINDKHIEIIVKQMLKKRKVIDPGDTTLMKDELVEKEKLERINHAMEEKGLRPATWDVVLLGITKAALNTESFFSAASFQETTKVLTNASVERKRDILRGIKENIIIGKMIPAGTGFPKYNEANYEIKIPGMENAEIENEDDDVTAKVARSSFRTSRRLASEIDMDGAFDFSNISNGMEGDEEGFSETDDIPSGKDEE
jgi:DNA-directed RNA polymerase subunit beta'